MSRIFDCAAIARAHDAYLRERPLPERLGISAFGITAAIGSAIGDIFGASSATSGAISNGILNAGLGAALGAIGGNPGMGALTGGLMGLTGNGLLTSSQSGMPGLGGILSGILGTGQATGAYPSGTGSQPLNASVPNSQYGADQALEDQMYGSASPQAAAASGTQPGLGVAANAGAARSVANLMYLNQLLQGVTQPSLASMQKRAYDASLNTPSGRMFNTPLNTTGYINRTQTPGYQPVGNDWYTYGENANQPQFFSNNQLGFARGGALTHGRRGVPFSTANGEHLVQGDGGGQDDRINAKLSDGEWVADANLVSAIGDGSNSEGSRRLYEMRHKIMQDKGIKHTVPPKMKKSPLQYLAEAAR